MANPKRKPVNKAETAALERDTAQTYNSFKEFEGRRYTGMKIGRRHKWHYDPGVWTEKKITPDKWEVNYSVAKRRAGTAPEGSGVPAGTQYHWYIVAHQIVSKLKDKGSQTRTSADFPEHRGTSVVLACCVISLNISQYLRFC